MKFFLSLLVAALDRFTDVGHALYWQLPGGARFLSGEKRNNLELFSWFCPTYDGSRALVQVGAPVALFSIDWPLVCSNFSPTNQSAGLWRVTPVERRRLAVASLLVSKRSLA